MPVLWRVSHKSHHCNSASLKRLYSCKPNQEFLGIYINLWFQPICNLNIGLKATQRCGLVLFSNKPFNCRVDALGNACFILSTKGRNTTVARAFWMCKADQFTARAPGSLIWKFPEKLFLRIIMISNQPKSTSFNQNRPNHSSLEVK